MEQRKKSLIVLFMINFCGNSGYSFIIPLYPPLAIRKGLDESNVGYILCLYPVGAFFMSLILGQTMSNKLMKKVQNIIEQVQLMLLGLLLIIISTVGMALVEYINDKFTFTWISALMRLIAGIGATLCFTPSISLAAYLYPDKINEVLAQMEMVSGLAMFADPFLGGFFQVIGEKTPIGGYQLPYYVLCFIYVMTIPLLMYELNVEREIKQINIELSPFMHEQTLDTMISRSPQHQLKTNEISQPKLSYLHIFRIKGVIITYISYVFLFVFAMALQTYLAIFLQEEYDLTNSQSTQVFLCDTLTFTISAYIVGHQKTYDPKIIFAISLLISSIAYFIHGPDTELTGLPHELWIVILADALFGIGNGAICALIIPEFVNIIKESYPNREQDVNDIASALYISGWSLGEFIGPLLGSVIIPKYGFPTSGSIMGTGMFLVFLVYSQYVTEYKRTNIQFQKGLNYFDQDIYQYKINS